MFPVECFSRKEIEGSTLNDKGIFIFTHWQLSDKGEVKLHVVD